MATTISGALTQLTWYGPALNLSSTFPNKARIKRIRRINPAQAGYVSWTGGAANSLNTINTGDSITVEALGITAGNSSTYFSLDNGTAPTGGTAAPVTIDVDGTSPVAGETTFDASDPATGFASACTLTAAFSQGSGTVQVSTNNGSTWISLSATTATPIAANTFFITRVQHTAGAAFYATITATF